LKGAER